MKLQRRKAEASCRWWATAVPALLVALAVSACGPAGDGMEAESGEAAAESEGAMAGGEAGMMEGGMGQEAPACRWTASGEELTGRASPPDSASVALGGGTAKVCYSAPSIRGRQIMGGLVPYGEPWRMGANEPTTLHLPVAAEVGGVRVEAGSYALYAIPGESEWTIVLNSDPARWGIPINDQVRANDVGSFTVQPEAIDEAVERMTIEMESAAGGAARVVLEWENTRVSFPIQPVAGSAG